MYVCLTALKISKYMKIKQMERRKKKAGEASLEVRKGGVLADLL